MSKIRLSVQNKIDTQERGSDMEAKKLDNKNRSHSHFNNKDQTQFNISEKNQHWDVELAKKRNTLRQKQYFENSQKYLGRESLNQRKMNPATQQNTSDWFITHSMPITSCFRARPPAIDCPPHTYLNVYMLVCLYVHMFLRGLQILDIRH